MGICVLAIVGVLAAMGGEFAAHGCRAIWTEHTLCLENTCFVRDYVVTGKRLQTASFKLRTGSEWEHAVVATNAMGKMAVTAEMAQWSPVGAEGICVKVVTGEKESRLYVFPNVAGVLSILPEGPSVPRNHDLERDYMHLREIYAAMDKAMRENERFDYGLRHVRATTFICADQTDLRDQLLQADARLLMGNDSPFSVAATALDCQDVLTGEGLVFVRIAPMPLSRPKPVDDFIINGSKRQVALIANGYPLMELAYAHGDAGRQRALIAFQRALRPYRPGRDGLLLSNTWGAGNRDSRICQDFLLKEIAAGARMGVDVIQIDDGWQHGRTQNSNKKANAGKKKVWSGYWESDPDFWTEDRERFPDGLELLTRKAREQGMRFGLWFGPDSSNDAANWERDADCLLDYHRRLGIDYFKMDSMKLFSATALANNRRMFDKMLRLSNGEMVFDLDCTAEVRPGFFGLMDIGPLFVENRYTHRPVYWPHHTLKNLWDLSHMIDPVRLRFEFNNPDTNHAAYEWSPLSHGKYRPDTLFATVMTASPLAWMELSDVSEASIAAIAPLVRTWKAERARWHGGTIHPVAERPDGIAWTGFVSEAADGQGGYALIFRELNNAASYDLNLKAIFDERPITAAEVIAGRGTATLKGNALSVTVPEKLDYVWVKLNP